MTHYSVGRDPSMAGWRGQWLGDTVIAWVARAPWLSLRLRSLQDKFQVKFWKLRQAEFEPYKYLYDPVSVPVGELSSPIYFDFIAFAQYQTISRIIPDSPQVFKVHSLSSTVPAIDFLAAEVPRTETGVASVHKWIT